VLFCIVGYVRIENEGGLWTLQVTITEFDGLIVSVYCRVSQKLSLLSKRWYGHGRIGRTSCYSPGYVTNTQLCSMIIMITLYLVIHVLSIHICIPPLIIEGSLTYQSHM